MARNRLVEAWARWTQSPVATANGSGRAAPEAKAIQFHGINNLAQITLLPGGVWGLDPTAEVDEVTRFTAYAASVYAYAAIRFRAQKLAEPPLWVAQETDDGEEWLRDHPLQQLLDTPNPDMDMSELLTETSLALDITGEALWAKSANARGEPGALYLFSGDDFTVQQTADRIFGEFWVHAARGGARLLPEDVVYFHDPLEPLRNRNGKPRSRLDVAMQWLNLGQTTAASVRSLVRNSLLPSLVATPDKDWNPDEHEFERYKSQLQGYSQYARKGQPLVMLGGGSVQSVATKLRDMLPGDILNRVEANVALAFSVRPEVLGMAVGLENSPWSHIQEARRITYEDAIDPAWRRIESTLTRQLLPEPDRAARRFVRFDRTMVAALRVDQSARAATIPFVEKIWTVGEARLFTGQEPFGDERDDERVIDVGRPAPLPMPDADAADVDLDDDDAEAMTAAAPERKALDHRTWRALQATLRDALEMAWEFAAEIQLAEDRARIVEAVAQADLKAVQPAEAKQIPPRIRQLMDEIAARLGLEERWLERVRPLVRRSSQQSVERMVGLLGISFDLVQPGIREFAEREAAWLVTEIGRTTRDTIAAELAASLEAGESIAQRTARLRDSVAFGQDRARLVARTETTRLMNGAQRQALEDYSRATGAAVFKTWLNAGDDRVRDEHLEPLNGETVPIDQPFMNGLMEPGEPNCRCTLVYEIREAA